MHESSVRCALYRRPAPLSESFGLTRIWTCTSNEHFIHAIWKHRQHLRSKSFAHHLESLKFRDNKQSFHQYVDATEQAWRSLKQTWNLHSSGKWIRLFLQYLICIDVENIISFRWFGRQNRCYNVLVFKFTYKKSQIMGQIHIFSCYLKKLFSNAQYHLNIDSVPFNGLPSFMTNKPW